MNPSDSTEHHNNVLYRGLGRPCPLCHKVFLSCSVDLQAHVAVCKGRSDALFKKSKWGADEEWCFAGDNPDLKRSLAQNGGRVQLGMWIYSLSQDGKFIKRKLEREKE